MATYGITAALFAISFCYSIVVKEHTVSYTVIAIYILSILSMSTGCTAITYPQDSEKYLNLAAVSFSAHWLSLGIFTGAYIKVATQTPLFRGGERMCNMLPLILKAVIVLILCGTYYTFAFVHSAAPYLTWLAFVLKTCLSLTIMTIQIACLYKIKGMILEVVDLEFNYNE